MSTSSINTLPNSYLQSMLGTALQGTGSTTGANKDGSSAIATLSSMESPDNGQISPFAQLLSKLQQLQQSNPTEYSKVTQQIATNLNKAAQTAHSEGNTTAANQLTQLATDFTAASKSGQPIDLQNLAHAVHGHHHQHAHASSGHSDSSSGDSDSSSSSSASNQSLNPMSIIMNSVTGYGTGGSNNSLAFSS